MTIYAAAMGPVGAPLHPGGGDVSATQVAGQVEQRDAARPVLMAVRPATGTSTSPRSVPPSSSNLPAARTHDKSGIGPSCAGLQTFGAAMIV
jgi:hypothetical protein